MPLRVLLVATGTRGDVQPFLALAMELRARGHTVAVATHRCFQELLWSVAHGEDDDVAFFGLDGNPGALLHSPDFVDALFGDGGDAAAVVQEDRWASQVKNARLMLQAAGDFGPDALVGGIQCLPEVHTLAIKLGKPCFALDTFPTFPSAHYAPVTLAAAPIVRGDHAVARAVNKGAHMVVQNGAWSIFKPVVNALRQECGLPPASGLDPTGIVHIHAFSDRIVPTAPDWPPERVHAAGSLVFAPKSAYEPPPTLADFLAAGSTPVYIGFGSMPLLEPAGFVRAAARVVERLDLRLILCGSWTRTIDPEIVPAHVHLVSGVPHQFLFDGHHCSIAVHHGGAGTTAAAMRAGLPQVIFPALGDQYFWAQRAHELGVAPPPVPMVQLTAAALEQQLADAMSNARRAAARGLASALADERPAAATAADVVERETAAARPVPPLEWAPDSSAAACLACGASFSFVRRRHHCRLCGKIFCGSCVHLSPVLNYGAPQNVCGPCDAT